VPTNNPQWTSLKLLADDGIIHVTFESALTPDQSVELARTSIEFAHVSSLDSALLALGRAWGIVTVTQIVHQSFQQA
jgi:hypothetical protein